MKPADPDDAKHPPRYFYCVDGLEQGPVMLEQIRVIARGHADLIIRRSDQTSGQEAQFCPELADIFNSHAREQGPLQVIPYEIGLSYSTPDSPDVMVLVKDDAPQPSGSQPDDEHASLPTYRIWVDGTDMGLMSLEALRRQRPAPGTFILRSDKNISQPVEHLPEMGDLYRDSVPATPDPASTMLAYARQKKRRGREKHNPKTVFWLGTSSTIFLVAALFAALPSIIAILSGFVTSVACVVYAINFLLYSSHRAELKPLLLVIVGLLLALPTPCLIAMIFLTGFVG